MLYSLMGDLGGGKFSLFLSEMWSNFELYEIKILRSSRDDNRISTSVRGEWTEDFAGLWLVSGEKK